MNLWDYQYILNDDHTYRKAQNQDELVEQFRKWHKAGKFVKGHPKVVDKTQIGEAEVSTVFVPFDMSFFRDEPIVFETMVFGGEWDDQVQRYSSWEEAQEGHDRFVKAIQNGQDPEGRLE